MSTPFPLPPSSFRLVEGGQTWTAGDLASATRPWTDALVAAGVAPGEPVAVWAPNGSAWVAALLAVRRAQASLVPFHSRLTATEIRALAAHAGCRLLLATIELAQRLPDSGNLTVANLPPVGAPLAIPSFGSPVTPLPTEYLVYTSGTTGHPKGVLLSESAFRIHAQLSRDRLHCAASDRWLALLPFAHLGGLAMLLRTIEHGTQLTLREVGPDEPLDDAINHYGITHLSLVPTQLHRWLEERPSASSTPTLRCVLLGGAPADSDLLRRAARAGLPVRATYGLTEACSQVATAYPESPLDTVGPPLPRVQVRIESDEVWVRGPTLFHGYHRDPEGTKATFNDGWFRTGDRGRLDASGNLRILGRRTDLIISGGENVDPAEVEAVLESHPAVAHAGVVGLPDLEWGERVAAAVVFHPGRSASPVELRAHCQRFLADFKCPRAFLPVAELPRTSTGKPQRGRLKRHLAEAGWATTPT